MELAEVQRLAQDLARNLEQVMVGKRPEIELLLVGLLCQGHLLIEDVPGVGKTVLAAYSPHSIPPQALGQARGAWRSVWWERIRLRLGHLAGRATSSTADQEAS